MSQRSGMPNVSRRQALKLLGLGAAGLGLLSVGGCAGAPNARPASSDRPDSGPVDYSARFAGFDAADEPNGDLTKVVWPAFVTRAGPEVKRLYEFQIEHGELMRYMPCFCGCQDEDDHRSNRDCYVESVNSDGSVVLDSMAPT